MTRSQFVGVWFPAAAEAVGQVFECEHHQRPSLHQELGEKSCRNGGTDQIWRGWIL